VGVWEYPGAGVIDPNLGYTYSYASILKTEAAGWVVITGNGYDSTNGLAILYVFDALTGAVLAQLDTEVGDCNGLSSPVVTDLDNNGYIDFVYAGDLKGNMWKFDLRGASVGDWKIAFYDGTTPKPLVSISDSAGNPQPITNIPDVMFVANCNPPGSKGVLVVFGTGKYLGITDLDDGSQQSIYAVYDWGPDWEIKDGPGSDSDKFLGTLTLDSPRKLSNSANGTGKDLVLVEQTITTTSAYNGVTYRYISNNPVEYYNVQAAAGEALGWHINLPDYGERAVRRPIIRNNVVLMITNIPEKAVCSAGGRSVFYELDACSGGWPETAQFDVDGDGDFDDDDMIGDPFIPTDAQLLASAYDADGDGDVDWDDVLVIYDSNNDGTVSDEERQILQPPIGREYDSMLLDITILGDVAYTPDADAGDIDKQNLVKRRGFPFWQIIE
jgi:type IV pilus assembly protein PilY1